MITNKSLTLLNALMKVEDPFTIHFEIDALDDLSLMELVKAYEICTNSKMDMMLLGQIARKSLYLISRTKEFIEIEEENL